jgi:tetratricopeptide (TPR) repeat protein
VLGKPFEGETLMSPRKVIAGVFLLTVYCLCALSYADAQVVSLKNKQEEYTLARTTLRHAADIAVKIKNEPIGRDSVLRWIVVSQARAEDVPEAFKTATKIRDPKDKVLAMADIASAQATLGQTRGAAETFRRAQVLAASLKDLSIRAGTLGKIAELLDKSQNHADAAHTFAQAIQAANTLPTEREKASIFFYIGLSQLESGNTQAATTTFKEASRYLSTEQDVFRKWMMATQLVPSLVKVGDEKTALALAHTFTDQQDRDFRSLALKHIAAQQAKEGKIEEALKTSSDIERDIIREEALEAIAEAQSIQGHVQQAIQLTETIQHNWLAKTLALLAIAKAQRKAGESAEAAQRVEQAADLFVKDVSDSPSQFQWAHIRVVEQFIEAGSLKKATEAAEVQKLAPVKAQALARVGEAYAKIGDSMTAQKLLEQALESGGSHGFVLGQIAQSYAQIGDVPAALKTAGKIPREFDGSYALQRIADTQTQQGDPKESLKWANALESPYLKSFALSGVALGILHKFGIEVRPSVW